MYPLLLKLTWSSCRRKRAAGLAAAPIAGLSAMTAAAALHAAAALSRFTPGGGPARQLKRRMAALADAFAEAFPDRNDRLTLEDGLGFAGRVGEWQRLLPHYDVVQGYSTSTAEPMLAGHPYTAFEHGTIREIPYAATRQGRLTALSYHHASHVFVTNIDCVASADRLAPGRYTTINHPFDEEHGRGDESWRPLRADLCAALDADLLFFFPARHDWVPGRGQADKGNDVFFRGFAALRRAGVGAGLVCCAWGSNVAESRSLIDSLGCSRHVKWVQPMPAVRFERMARAVHCVVDQFVLGAFGGILFKAAAVGAPVLTYLNDTLARQARVYHRLFSAGTARPSAV
jgi:hypothetical protein